MRDDDVPEENFAKGWGEKTIQVTVFGRRTMSPEIEVKVFRRKNDNTQVLTYSSEGKHTVFKEWLEATLRSGYTKICGETVKNCPTLDFEIWEKPLSRIDFEKGNLGGLRWK